MARILNISIVAYIGLVFTLKYYVANVRTQVRKYVRMMQLVCSVYVQDRIIDIMHWRIKDIQHDDNPFVKYVIQ